MNSKELKSKIERDSEKFFRAYAEAESGLTFLLKYQFKSKFVVEKVPGLEGKFYLLVNKFSREGYLLGGKSTIEGTLIAVQAGGHGVSIPVAQMACTCRHCLRPKHLLLMKIFLAEMAENYRLKEVFVTDDGWNVLVGEHEWGKVTYNPNPKVWVYVKD